MIEIQDLSSTYGDFRLGPLTLTLEEGEYLVLVGPTGAGKTQLLECITGLQTRQTGRVYMADQDVSSWTPERRRLGYVPQDYLLLPFLSVKENILFPARLQGLTEERALSSLGRVVDMLGIGHILTRQTKSLSGGEQQRAALARALVTEPRILLMDEPYAALHAGLRRKLWLEMKLMHARFGTTVMHVTHDLEEAFMLGSRVAVLIAGAIAQIGNKDDIYRRPVNKSVAEFLGMINIFKGHITEITPGQDDMCVKVRGYEFSAPFRPGSSVGDEVSFCIHADRIRIVPDHMSTESGGGRNCIDAQLVVSTSDGIEETSYFKILDASCVCKAYNLEVRSRVIESRETKLQPGQTARLAIDQGAVHVFEKS